MKQELKLSNHKFRVQIKSFTDQTKIRLDIKNEKNGIYQILSAKMVTSRRKKNPQQLQHNKLSSYYLLIEDMPSNNTLLLPMQTAASENLTEKLQCYISIQLYESL